MSPKFQLLGVLLSIFRGTYTKRHILARNYAFSASWSRSNAPCSSIVYRDR